MSATTAPWDIYSALIKAVVDATIGLPTGYPMKDFDPPADAGWAEVIMLGDDRFVETLGDNGQDGWEGIMQIDVHYPENDGPKNLQTKVGLLLEFFKAGRTFTKNGQLVKVRRSSPSAIRKDGASYVKSVSVYWSSWTQR